MTAHVIRLGIDLDERRAQAELEIDQRADRLRAAVTSPSAGQRAVYDEKARQAALCLAQGDPAPEGYPFVAIDAELGGQSMREAAQAILDRAAATRAADLRIERLRRMAKQDVRAAATVAAIRLAVQGVAIEALSDTSNETEAEH